MSQRCNNNSTHQNFNSIGRTRGAPNPTSQNHAENQLNVLNATMSNLNLRQADPSTSGQLNPGQQGDSRRQSANNQLISANSFSSRANPANFSTAKYGNMVGLGFQAGTSHPSQSQVQTDSTAVTTAHSQNTSLQYGTHNQTPFRQVQNGNVQSQSQNQGPHKGIDPKQSFINQMAAKYQAKLTEIQSLISKLPGDRVSKESQDMLKEMIRKMSQEFNETQRQVQEQWDKERQLHFQTRSQLANAERRLADSQREFSAILRDRQRITQERDDLQLKVNQLRMSHKSSSERLSVMEKQWETKNLELMDKLRKQEEQLSGKRALWMQANPESSARRDAMSVTLRDPYNTPPQGDIGAGTMVSVGSPTQRGTSKLSFDNMSKHDQKDSKFALMSPYEAPPRMKLLPSGPSGGNRPRSNLPTGSARLDISQGLSILDITNNSRAFNTEPGQPENSTTMVLYDSKGEYIDPSPPYIAAVTKLFGLIEKWVMKYSNVPNKESDRIIATTNQELWHYILDLTYPGLTQDAQMHAQTLLSDRSTRSWFVFRMICQYCLKQIVAVKAFKDFSPDVDREITQVAEKLKERGLAMEARQRLVSKQHHAIERVIAHAHFKGFRQMQLNEHTKALRDMVGPLLNADCARAEAGKELGALVVHTWEMSVKMNTSHLTFQIFFPETCSKYQAATMNPKELPDADRMKLQAKQVRLKLVITPVITLRDDRGTTIRAKSVCHSDVLLME